MVADCPRQQDEPSSVSTRFAISTGRSSDKNACVSEIFRLDAAQNQAGLIEDEHAPIRLDYACIRIE
jgi:hypothetical protein